MEIHTLSDVGRLASTIAVVPESASKPIKEEAFENLSEYLASIIDSNWEKFEAEDSPAADVDDLVIVRYCKLLLDLRYMESGLDR